jgi:hypothetical protein
MIWLLLAAVLFTSGIHGLVWVIFVVFVLVMLANM